jgi:hypothetical protein
MMPASAIEVLRGVNQKLRVGLNRFRPEHASCLAIQPQELSELRQAIHHAAESMATLPTDLRNSELENEILQYKLNLEKLSLLLPSFQGRMLAERIRLETALKMVAGAAAWAQTSKKTF